ncbi:trp26 thioredoxin family protein, putative [Ichthyophthirius multifiliis]|uniref:Trp26 thioredoxin family protein, putative n=1 Tax=Ichthyophthirius multifiliis TaxID=5932 RepID=G0QJ12_ICHMU|nr:trp26 thioredoxin family protein, putative [Ichthyophthirius multifiliis]EGR34805.1 trp26 thioredoxin family protein, putative [Ichthyophthirius multifiliis]|eukprot:XP_004040109.1 trp26 thioredoxin family protein, putative [Ichthyophthirius multifiliis]
MDHVHNANCSCKEYAGVENATDLYTSIDLQGIMCLNEEQESSGKNVFRSEEDKFNDNDKFVSSDDPDPELIFIIPFLSIVKLKSINIIARNSDTGPTNLKVYINQENVDFSILETKPEEEFQIDENLDGNSYQSVRQTKFQNVSKLILHISAENKQKISINYIGLKGENTKMKRQIVEAIYEVKPMAAENDPEKTI